MNIYNSRSAVHRARLLFKRPRIIAMLATSFLAACLLAGCSIELPGVVIPGITEQGTPTPNPTLLAIASMLTETAAIPTVTNTPLPTLTPLPGPTSTATPEPPVQGQLGEPLFAKNIGFTVLSTTARKEFGKQPASQGKLFLDLEVLIENQSGQGQPTLPYTVFYFRLTDAAGQAYNPFIVPQEALAKGVPPRLLGGDLLPGEAVRGYLAFEVPQESGGFTLAFTTPAPAADLIPPVFAVQISEPMGSIPSGSIPTTGAGAENVEISTEPWLSSELPGQDNLVSLSGASLKIEMAHSAERFEGKKAPTGTRFLILDVVIRNDAHPRMPFNPQYFKVKDERGFEYPPTILPGDAVLQAGSMGEGQRVSGAVVFQIPLEARHVGVIYQPRVLEEEWDAFRIVINVPEG